MILYPAIDIKDNKCVRLLQGRMDDVTIFGEDTAVMARRWRDEGARWLHVVDLNGAFEGKSVNSSGIKAITSAVNIPVQLGGGLRTIKNIEYALNELGITRAIIGTAAINNPQLVKEAIDRWGSERIAVGIDAKAGNVAVKGWAEVTDVKAVDLAIKMKSFGVTTIIYTDISRDGMMTGPNLKETQKLIDDTNMDIIISGGMSKMGDVKRAFKTDAVGIILGRAIYSGDIDLNLANRLLEVKNAD